jgi:hypothetical protein
MTILGSLHPRMPKKSVIVRAITFGWVVDLGDRNEAVRGKLLHELDDIAARNVELFRELIEGGPSVTLASREIRQVSVELLSLFGNLRPLLKPLRHPHTVKQAMRIDKV